MTVAHTTVFHLPPHFIMKAVHSGDGGGNPSFFGGVERVYANKTNALNVR